MNGWLVASLVLIVALIPCGVVCIRRTPPDAIVALEGAATIVALILLLISLGAERSIYASVALVIAGLDLAGGLAFARFLDRLG
jgi:multicomponent Na+:H+ antiporter subunit F